MEMITTIPSTLPAVPASPTPKDTSRYSTERSDGPSFKELLSATTAKINNHIEKEQNCTETVSCNLPINSLLGVLQPVIPVEYLVQEEAALNTLPVMLPTSQAPLAGRQEEFVALYTTANADVSALKPVPQGMPVVHTLPEVLRESVSTSKQSIPQLNSTENSSLTAVIPLEPEPPTEANRNQSTAINNESTYDHKQNKDFMQFAVTRAAIRPNNDQFFQGQPFNVKPPKQQTSALLSDPVTPASNHSFKTVVAAILPKDSGDEATSNGFAKQDSEQIKLENVPQLKSESIVSNSSFPAFMEKHILSVTQPEVREAAHIQPQNILDKNDIASQIIEHAKFISKPQNTEMIIKLKPEHLGELTFKVSVDQGVVSASFHSNNSEVRTVIESTLAQLKQEFSNQGIKFDSVGVFAGMDQFLSGDHRSGQQFQQQNASIVQRKDLIDNTEAIIDLATADNSEMTTGVDYRV